MMGKGTRKQPRTARWQRATALLPLVMLSGALSANASTEREQVSATTGPGAPAVPSTAFEQPASVSLPGAAMSSMSGLTARLAPESSFDFFTGDAPSTTPRSMGGIGGTSVNGIPASALRAYQRAAAILNQADPACNLDWTLVAGIGKVESDHGRYGGNALDAEGVAQPGIYGLPLNGSNGTALIRDTDNGVYDNDTAYDRAVGPMQFIPSTWEMAGVDADQDGRQDPQDIDDAATASAVYLCAGSDDLSTAAGQQAAVYRYNQSQEYVDLVLSIAAAYAGGEYTAVPNGTPSSSTLISQDFAADGRPAKGTHNRPAGSGSKGDSTSGGTASGGSVSGSDGGNGGSGDGGSGGGSGGGDQPSGGRPDNDGPDNDGDRNDNPDNGDGDQPTPDPVGDAVDQARKTVKDKVGDATGGGGGGGGATEPVEDVLSSADARSLCESRVLAALVGKCTSLVTGKTRAEALDIIAGL